MPRMLVAVLALLVACAHAGKGAPPPKDATPPEVVAMAKATVDSWQKAYEAKSVETIGKLYAHDDVSLVIDGVLVSGWKSIEPLRKDKLARAKEIHVRLKDVQTRSLAPNVALATALMTREIGDGVTTVTENGALTLVLHRDDTGDWKVVAEHYSYRRP